MHISILGIDNGKNSRSVVGVDDRGAAVVRRTMRRQSLIEFVQKLPTCVATMEACCLVKNVVHIDLQRPGCLQGSKTSEGQECQEMTQVLVVRLRLH